MFVALWEFEVKPGHENRFERVYGPGGDWVLLFRSDKNYQGTRLLRDASRHGIYLTIDFWSSHEAYERFRRTAANAYAEIDTECQGLTTSERYLGSFEDCSS